MSSLPELPPGMLPQGEGGQDAPDKEEKRAREEQMRRDLMATVLDSGARERLSRISMVSPERSLQIETMLLRMAQTGQLKGRVTEAQLIDLLEQMEEVQGKSTAKKPTIIFQRRRDFDDDDF